MDNNKLMDSNKSESEPISVDYITVTYKDKEYRESRNVLPYIRLIEDSELIKKYQSELILLSIKDFNSCPNCDKLLEKLFKLIDHACELSLYNFHKKKILLIIDIRKVSWRKVNWKFWKNFSKEQESLAGESIIEIIIINYSSSIAKSFFSTVLSWFPKKGRPEIKWSKQPNIKKNKNEDKVKSEDNNNQITIDEGKNNDENNDENEEENELDIQELQKLREREGTEEY